MSEISEVFNFLFKLIQKFKKIQLSLAYKKKKSDFIIENKYTNKSVESAIKVILNKIC